MSVEVKENDGKLNVKIYVFGKEAKKIAQRAGLKIRGDIGDSNSKLTFTYGSCGHVELEFDL